jgi:hypothetical protein
MVSQGIDYVVGRTLPVLCPTSATSASRNTPLCYKVTVLVLESYGNGYGVRK